MYIQDDKVQVGKGEIIKGSIAVSKYPNNPRGI
jgi:hypothetical protein